MSNRNVLKKCAILLIAIFLVSTGQIPASAAATTSSAYEIQSVSAEDALQGNKRHIVAKLSDPGKDEDLRTEVAKGQHPIAVILSCSDSPVPPEVIFDQGLGDLFVIRTPGHVADEVAIGRIQYAVEHLGVQLIMVLGHEKCGVVDATIKSMDDPAHKEGDVCIICGIVDAIKPAVVKAKARDGDLLDNSVEANVNLVAEKVMSSRPVFAELAADGKLKVVGGYYDLDSGAVTLTYNP